MYCNNPDNERHIWTWADCIFEERVRKWELPTKWYEHIDEFKKVFGKILIQFPKQNKDFKYFKKALEHLFADFYLEPIFNNDYGNNCFLVCFESMDKLKEDCETIKLRENEFYYSELGILKCESYSDTFDVLEHLRKYFQSHYELTPKYFVEKYRITEEEAKKTKIEIYLMAKRIAFTYVNSVAHRELETKIQLQKAEIPFTITVIHKDFHKHREELKDLLVNPRKFESPDLKCQETWYEKDEKIDVDEETNQIVDVEYKPEFLLLNYIGVPRPVEYKRCDVFSLNPSFWEISYSRN